MNALPDRKIYSFEWKRFVKEAGPVGRNTFERRRIGHKRYDPGYKDLKTEFPVVYDFYRDIAPYIRMRELGVDKLPENEEKAFREILDVPVVYNDSERFPGHYAPWREFLGTRFSKYNPIRYIFPRDHVSLSRKTSLQRKNYDAAHEYRHALERRIGLSEEAKRALNDVYGFRGANIMGQNAPGWFGRLYSMILGDEEMATTNVEHQIDEYMKLRQKMEREGKGKPSGKEFLDHIDGMGTYLAQENRRNTLNGYQDVADREIDLKNRKDYWNVMENAPYSFEYEGGSRFPSWIDFAPHTKDVLRNVRTGEKVKFNPRQFEVNTRDEEEANKIKKVLGGVSMLDGTRRTMGQTGLDNRGDA